MLLVAINQLRSLSLLMNSTDHIPIVFLDSIDATSSTGRMCHLVNDAKAGTKDCNAEMKVVEVDGKPHLCLFALKYIPSGKELMYDYGDQDRKLWWRSKVRF